MSSISTSGGAPPTQPPTAPPAPDPAANTVTLTIDGANGEEKIDGTHLLVAAGRKQTVDGLGLEAAGIRYDKAGIAVSKSL